MPFLVLSGYIVFIFLVIWRCVSIANNKDNLPVNENIKVDELLVIGPNGEKLGLKNLADALTLASYSGLDLVLINGNTLPYVGKIMDYNKYRYERQRQQKEALKKQRETNKDIKEYQLSVAIDVGDFNTRVKNATSYLQKGHKIKGVLRFKGRQMAHPEFGEEVLRKFATALSEYGIIETPPKMEGRNMHMLIAPKK